MNLDQTNKKRILIVEDDAISSFIAERILKKNYLTSTVTNGYAALEAVEKDKYDAILMDINLGDDRMDGLKTMRLIKQNPKHKRIKIFAITSYSDIKDWYIKQGFEDLFLKPLGEEAILRVLQDKLVDHIKGKSLFTQTTMESFV